MKRRYWTRIVLVFVLLLVSTFLMMPVQAKSAGLENSIKVDEETIRYYAYASPEEQEIIITALKGTHFRESEADEIITELQKNLERDFNTGKQGTERNFDVGNH